MAQVENITSLDVQDVASHLYQYAAHADRIMTNVLGDGTYWAYEYDGQDRLTGAVRYRADGSIYAGQQFGYQYDAAGNPVRAGLVRDGQPMHAFEANDFNLHVRRIWSNRLEVAGCAVTQAVVSVNKVRAVREGSNFVAVLPVNTMGGASMLTVTVYAVWFDGTNDVVAKHAGRVYLPKADETVSYTLRNMLQQESRFNYAFDGMGRLTTVIASNATPPFKVEYAYYPGGQLATRKVFRQDPALRSPSGEAGWSLTTDNSYLWSDWRLLRESEICHLPSQMRTTVRSFAWGLDIGEQRNGKYGVTPQAGAIGGLVAIREVSGAVTNTYFPLCDRQGTITHVLDTNGVIVAEYAYSPVGAVVSVGGSKPEICSFGFQSKLYDQETELYCFGYRWYEPRAMKWISPDPLQ